MVAIESIPEHLLPYVAEQDPSRYTAIDHAAWRFILRIAKDFFAAHAHQKYLGGLDETGISLDRIPLISEIDAKLRQFGWRAVGVSGFIPPAIFMEFQSLGILPIACEMRTLDHLAYTPAPDIVHEAAGHAPILADPEYAKYLRSYGEVARRAIYSSKDMEVYNAIRTLSDVKEDPHSSAEQIEKAQQELEQTVAGNTEISEATQLSRMFWWTVEYGLVGTLEQPKIYGAGLLSSVGESYDCLKEEVKKHPLDMRCIDVTYDITRPQPQLFVTRDFHSLNTVLEELASRMAYRVGGTEGLKKARAAGTVTTVEFESGLQVSGVLAEYRLNQQNEPVFLKWSGPVQISRQDKELTGQGAERHAGGFSLPMGQIESRSEGVVRFRSGIQIQAKKEQGHPEGLSVFEECEVRSGEGEVLYRSEWGPFDWFPALRIVSVFGGAADRARYLESTGEQTIARRVQKTNLTQENRPLVEIYAEIRSLRESGVATVGPGVEVLSRKLDQTSKTDWLARLELFELLLTNGQSPELAQKLLNQLRGIVSGNSSLRVLLDRGLQAVGWNEAEG